MSFSSLEIKNPSSSTERPPKRPDLQQRLEKRRAEKRAHAEAERLKREKGITAFEDAEKADQIRESIVHGTKKLEHPVFRPDATPGVRRKEAERESSDLMEQYLRLKNDLSKLPAPMTEEEEKSPLRATGQRELVRLSEKLDAALLRESLVETADPLAAYAHHQALRREKNELEARLRVSKEARELRTKLTDLMKKQGEDHLLPSMIDHLPPREQTEARRWYEMEKASLLERSHVDRLRTWHERKSELDLAKVDLVAQCKTCNIPEEIRAAFQNPHLNKEKRDKDLLEILPSLDQPKTLAEWGTFLGIKAARLLGLEPGRTYANAELHERMHRIKTLEAAFNEVADTKGAFIGRRTPYQSSRDSSLVSRGGIGYSAVQKETLIGDPRFRSTREGEAESFIAIEAITKEAESCINALKTIKTLTESHLKGATESIYSLQKRLRSFEKTFAVDSGEYQVAKEAITSAETALRTAQDLYQAEQDKNAKHEREQIEFANEISHSAKELTEEILKKDGFLEPEDPPRFIEGINAIDTEIRHIKLPKTHAAYKKAVEALEDTREALATVKLTMKSDLEIKAKRSARQRANAQKKLEADPLREKRSDVIASIISERIRTQSREADKLVEELLSEDPTHDPDTIILNTYLRSLHQLQDPEAFPDERDAVKKTLDHINRRLGIYEQLGVQNWEEFSKKMRSRHVHSRKASTQATPNIKTSHEQGPDLFAKDVAIGEQLDDIRNKAARIEQALQDIHPRFASALIAATKEQLEALSTQLRSFQNTPTQASPLYTLTKSALAQAQAVFTRLTTEHSTDTHGSTTRPKKAA